jgi:TonB family protein
MEGIELNTQTRVRTTLIRQLTAALTMGLLAAALPVNAHAATPTLLVEPLPEFQSLNQLDTLLDGRNRMEWSVRNETPGPEWHVFGKPLVDYANQYIFTPAADAGFKDLRVRAGSQSAAGARAAYTDTLRQAREALDFEAYRVAVLYEKRDLSTRVTAHEAALQTFLDKVPAAERQQTRARIDPLVEQARASVDQLLRIATLDELQRAYASDPTTALAKVYNEERMRLAPMVAALDREQGIKPMSRVRTSPCNPLYPRPSTTGKPQLEQSTLKDPGYPPETQRMALEGVVHIRAEISPKGCADRMEIARSAGVEALDAAALAWAESVRFHPAQVNGEPQAASYTFGVTFQLDH